VVVATLSIYAVNNTGIIINTRTHTHTHTHTHTF